MRQFTHDNLHRVTADKWMSGATVIRTVGWGKLLVPRSSLPATSNCQLATDHGFAYNLDSQMTTVLRFDPTTASPHPDSAMGSYGYDGANRLTSLNV